MRSINRETSELVFDVVLLVRVVFFVIFFLSYFLFLGCACDFFLFLFRLPVVVLGHYHTTLDERCVPRLATLKTMQWIDSLNYVLLAFIGHRSCL